MTSAIPSGFKSRASQIFFRPYFHCFSRSIHNCEDRFHIRSEMFSHFHFVSYWRTANVARIRFVTYQLQGRRLYYHSGPNADLNTNYLQQGEFYFLMRYGKIISVMTWLFNEYGLPYFSSDNFWVQRFKFLSRTKTDNKQEKELNSTGLISLRSPNDRKKTIEYYSRTHLDLIASIVLRLRLSA